MVTYSPEELENHRRKNVKHLLSIILLLSPVPGLSSQYKGCHNVSVVCECHNSGAQRIMSLIQR